MLNGERLLYSGVMFPCHVSVTSDVCGVSLDL